MNTLKLLIALSFVAVAAGCTGSVESSSAAGGDAEIAAQVGDYSITLDVLDERHFQPLARLHLRDDRRDRRATGGTRRPQAPLSPHELIAIPRCLGQHLVDDMLEPSR